MRYADDILLGFTGPKAEAEEIKRRLAQFLHEDLKLELSETKTLITHARTSAARFLGYEIIIQHDNRKLTAGRRSVNGQIRLRVPGDVIKAKCARYMRGGKPARPTRADERAGPRDHQPLRRRVSGHRPVLPAGRRRLPTDRLHWVMLTSLLKTLAGKYGSSVTKMARKYKATIETPHGPRKCMQASVERGEGRKPLVATFGGIPLRRQKHAVLNDRAASPGRRPRQRADRSAPGGTVRGLRTSGQVQVHQIRKLADLDRPGQPDQPEWAQDHGKAATQDPRGLRRLPRQDPPGRPTASITE